MQNTLHCSMRDEYCASCNCCRPLSAVVLLRHVPRHAVRNIARTVCGYIDTLASSIDCKHSGLPPQG